jgi:hypothetical protein
MLNYRIPTVHVRLGNPQSAFRIPQSFPACSHLPAVIAGGWKFPVRDDNLVQPASTRAGRGCLYEVHYEE